MPSIEHHFRVVLFLSYGQVAGSEKEVEKGSNTGLKLVEDCLYLSRIVELVNLLVHSLLGLDSLLVSLMNFRP